MGGVITVEEVMSMLAEIFEVPEGSIAPETPRDDITGWDSLGVLSLMAEYDDRFGITMTSEQLEAMDKVGDLIDILTGHGAIKE